MLNFNVVRNKDGEIVYIETILSSYDLLSMPKLNKGCAFTEAEREQFQLEGLLPSQIETLEQQIARTYAQYQEHPTHLSKNIHLNVLYDYNETLFYLLVSKHLEEMLPIIYTPTVGEAVQHFSMEFRKPPGLYINYQDRHKIKKIIEAGLNKTTNLLVVTDGEAVLGIGDQGIGGIKICNAKLMVYTLCGHLSPFTTMPVQLDVGTNNPYLLADPMYLGWRHERITGQAYDDFIDLFVSAIKKHLPYVYLHWEDVGRDNARRILTHYRQDICTLNGDMQSTGAVALACVLSGCLASHIKLQDQRIVIFGAGTAGVGIADQITAAMVQFGLSEQEARNHFWLLDKVGLLVNNQSTLLPFQKPYARPVEELSDWNINNEIGLLKVIKKIKPTILIGCSTVGGAFTEEVIKTMAQYTERPIVMPLSNPTQKSEAIPDDIVRWTDNRAIIATGSPFSEVDYAGQRIRITQSNNAFAFPGIGLGAIAVRARYLSDEMIWAAVKSLSECSPCHHDKKAPLLPKLSEASAISQHIALAVAKQARIEGLAQIPDHIDLETAIRQVSWSPAYYPYRLKRG